MAVKYRDFPMIEVLLSQPETSQQSRDYVYECFIKYGMYDVVTLLVDRGELSAEKLERVRLALEQNSKVVLLRRIEATLSNVALK